MRSEDGKIDFSEFINWAKALVSKLDETMSDEDLTQLFDLLDRDEDRFIEFSDILAFLFSMNTDLSEEERRLRSFRFYDRFNKYSIILNVGTIELYQERKQGDL